MARSNAGREHHPGLCDRAVRPRRGVGPHLSLKDRGITFGTNARRGICTLFREPITGIDFLGVIRHPGVTLTLADIEGFAAAVGHPLRS